MQRSATAVKTEAIATFVRIKLHIVLHCGGGIVVFKCPSGVLSFIGLKSMKCFTILQIFSFSFPPSTVSKIAFPSRKNTKINPRAYRKFDKQMILSSFLALMRAAVTITTWRTNVNNDISLFGKLRSPMDDTRQSGESKVSNPVGTLIRPLLPLSKCTNQNWIRNRNKEWTGQE